MNGKLARALRRVRASSQQKPTEQDIARVQRLTDRPVRFVKPLKVRAHKPKRAIKPTWPASKDQERQSRPLIVMRPLRATVRAMLERNPVNPTTGQRQLTELQMDALAYARSLPKHALDAYSLSV